MRRTIFLPWVSESPRRIDLLRGLAVLAEPPERRHGPIAESLGLPRPPTASEYSDVFLFQLYPYASVYLGPEGMMGGEARDRVAGFWKALGYAAPAEPDHLASLLGLYGTLAEHEATLEGAPRALTRQSRTALLHEHLAPWAFPYLDRMGELAPMPYREWAHLLSDALLAEISELDASPPEHPCLHYRWAPPLPDPRTEGAAAFLAGLLAPVRSGAVVTRADLARISSAADLALRAGERRYALEHLLAQDAATVLAALGHEVRRQGQDHDARVPRLGGSARFLRDRCASTATLLEALAAETAQPDGTGRARDP